MAQNAVPKRQQIASTAWGAAFQILQGVNILVECSSEQAAIGADGNFADSDFTATSNPYASAYNIGVLISTVGPNLAAALQAYVQGSSGAKNVDIIRLCIPTPPT